MKDTGWEDLMAARLRLLAAADEHQVAPRRVETSLLEAYRRRYARRSSGWPWVAAWGAVAASVLAFWAFSAAAPPRRAPQAPAVPPQAAPKAPARLEAQPAPALPLRKPSVRPKRYNVSAPPPAPVRSEIATEFIPLVYGESLAEEPQQVVRVRLPRAALASFGLPVDEERGSERVQADVVFGGDGMARAIRFVREVSARE
jgi:hypothetical protein